MDITAESQTEALTHPLPYARQSINEDDINAVVAALKSNFITQGPIIEKFEQAVAQYCGAQYAVAVCNATAALHSAYLALELGPGDILWTVPNTFVASANCALYCGAAVDFVDIDSKTYNMSVAALEEKLARASKNGKLPKVIVPVHFSGQSCEMQRIKSLADQYGCKVIEDASHAIGGSYLDNKVGGCQFSDCAVFSFHPAKIITTAEGGMIVTNNERLAEKLRLLRCHFVTRDQDLMQGESHGAWYYQQLGLGFNYRITDLQCALGLSQLQRLDEFIAKRKVIIERYNEQLKELPLQLPHQHPGTSSAWHLYVIWLKPTHKNMTRRQLFDALRAANIGVNVHYIPVHTQPFYQQLGFKQGDYPNSERYYEGAISLPVFAELDEKSQEFVMGKLRKLLG